jgi:hypothetical protein
MTSRVARLPFVIRATVELPSTFAGSTLGSFDPHNLHDAESEGVDRGKVVDELSRPLSV